MDANGHQWHCWRLWWLENEKVADRYWGAPVKQHWIDKCSEYALSLEGKPYPSIDLFRLAIEDITFGLISARNSRFDYCTEGWVNSIKNGWHHIPPILRDKFPTPWHIEEAARRKDLVSVCGNTSWLKGKVLS